MAYIYSPPLEGVDISVTAGVPSLLGTAGACIALEPPGGREVPTVSVAFDKIKDPGSPVNGVSSIYSSPYLERRLSASIRFRVSWYEVSLTLAVDSDALTAA